MCAVFRSGLANQGYDPSSTPPWQMVPAAVGARFVRLEKGSGLTVSSSDPSALTVEATDPLGVSRANDRWFLLQGKRAQKKSVYVNARDSSGNLKARLAVTVKPLRIVKVAFNFVQDSSGTKTARLPKDVTSMLNQMNWIYAPQAHVVFVRRSVRTITVPKDLGKVVLWSVGPDDKPTADHEWDDVVKLRDKTAHYNIFFVWKYEANHKDHHDLFDAGTWDSDSLVEDDDKGTYPPANEHAHIGRMLSHEALHFFYGNGVPHQERESFRLWYKDMTGGIYMNKQDIDAANPG